MRAERSKCRFGEKLAICLLVLSPFSHLHPKQAVSAGKCDITWRYHSNSYDSRSTDLLCRTKGTWLFLCCSNGGWAVNTMVSVRIILMMPKTGVSPSNILPISYPKNKTSAITQLLLSSCWNDKPVRDVCTWSAAYSIPDVEDRNHHQHH